MGIHKFIRQINQRQSFIRAIKKLPLSEISGPKPKLQADVSMESRISLDEMDAFVRVESTVNVPKKPPPLKVAAKKALSPWKFIIPWSNAKLMTKRPMELLSKNAPTGNNYGYSTKMKRNKRKSNKLICPLYLCLRSRFID